MLVYTEIVNYLGRDDMKTTIEFLDAVKARHSLVSDYKLAKKLEITPQSIIQYRNHRNVLSDSMAIRVAGLLEMDPVLVVTAVHAERAKRPEERALWADIVQRLGGVAAVLVLVFGLAGMPESSYAGNVSISHNSADFVHYVYSALRHKRRRALLIFLVFCLSLFFALIQ